MTTRPAEPPEPRTVYGAASATLSFNASTSGVVIPGLGLLVYALPEPHYHVPAKHDDLIQYGSELVVVVVFVLVAWRVVACHLFRAAPPTPERVPPS